MTSIHPFDPTEEKKDGSEIAVTGQPISSQTPGTASEAKDNSQAVETQDLPPGTIVIPRPRPIPGVPPGLEYLTKIDQLLIQQQFDALETFTRFEGEKKYKIKNSKGQQLFQAAEESSFCMRWCCGSKRSFVMHITDNFGEEVIRVSRVFKCCVGLCCCDSCDCLVYELQVEAPVGNICGYVRQMLSVCRAARYMLRDADRQDVLFVEGPVCIWHGVCCTADQEFKVFTPDRSREVGVLAKQWGGLGTELFTNSANFKAVFPIDLDVRMKAVALSAAFLIDFMFFSGQKE